MSPPSSSRDALTTAEAAALLQVSPATLKRWTQAGLLPSTRTKGGHRRFKASDVHVLVPGAQDDRTAAAADLMVESEDALEVAAWLRAQRRRRGSWWEVARLTRGVTGELCRRAAAGLLTGVDLERTLDRMRIAALRSSESLALASSAPLLLTAAVPGDPFLLTSAMIEICAPEGGWRVRWLGHPEVSELAAELTRQSARAVVVQHSAAVPADALGRYAPALDRLAESAGLPVAAIGLGTWPAAGSVEVLPSVETLRVWLEGVRARPARTARPAASGSAASRGAEATGWSPALAVGHGAIDTHHELLFAQIARLSQAVRDDAPAAVGRELLGFLGDYATVHFRVEEREMQRSDYPELAEYQWEHEGFLRELTRHRAAFEASDRSSAALAELARYLEGWLPRHVAGSDRRLGAHLRPSGDVDG